MAESNIVSLMNTLELTLHSNRLDHFLHAKQQITTLYRKVRLLQNLLQDNRSDEELNLLETQIRDSTYAVEVVVESTITEQIVSATYFMANSASVPDEKSSALEEAIEEIEWIVEELLKASCGLKALLPGKHSQVPSSRSRTAGGSEKIVKMVGFDAAALLLKDRLAGQESKLRAIPIVGMGGIGKSTLARNLYHDSLIEYYFDVRAWVTVSQTYRARDVLQSLLKGIGATASEQRQISIQDLSLSLYRNLKGRRYLIVLDDIWNTDVWDDLKRVFPDDVNGSRVMLTTRLVEVAVYSTDSSSPPHQLRLLDEDTSWELLRQEVFASRDCPSDFEEIGRMIATNCRGLPLAISVIGGLLANSSMTSDFWDYVSQNVNSIAMEIDEHCHEILSLSYRNLPCHLKPCFLYFGAFSEDRKISVTKIIRLWIAEGFLKPKRFKSLECTAEEYLNDLIDRNLVFVHRTGSDGKKRSCIIHDLLRDLCIKEAQNEKFLSIFNGGSSEDVPTRRMIHPGVLEEGEVTEDIRAAFDSLIYVRSLLQTGRFASAIEFHQSLMLLRVLDTLGAIFERFPVDLLLLVNLRYLAFGIRKLSVIPPHLFLLWKLQTLIIQDHENFLAEVMLPYVPTDCELEMPSQILKMTHLRHVQMAKSFRLADSVSSAVLKGMETLSTVANLRCTTWFLNKFPNLRKLGVCYHATDVKNWSDFHLEKLVHLGKLENLKCVFNSPPKRYLLPNLAFPLSLRKLTLCMSVLMWKDMTVVGSLPNLEVLKLKDYAFVGTHWEPTEGEFRRLEFLLIDTTNLEEWAAEETHFPRLKHLHLRHCHALNEVPSGIGEIASLQMIEIEECSHSAASSAMEILEEQRSMENLVLQVRVPALIEKLQSNMQKLVDSFLRHIKPQTSTTMKGACFAKSTSSKFRHIFLYQRYTWFAHVLTIYFFLKFSLIVIIKLFLLHIVIVTFLQ